MFRVLTVAAVLCGSGLIASPAVAQCGSPYKVIDNSPLGPYGGYTNSVPNYATNREVVTNQQYEECMQRWRSQQLYLQTQEGADGGTRRRAPATEKPLVQYVRDHETGEVVAQESTMPLPDRRDGRRPTKGAQWSCPWDPVAKVWIRDQCDWKYTQKHRARDRTYYGWRPYFGYSH
ncbi:MAG TPA: hypothetical protein VEA36_01570 [Candidatus Paceibacterota bacterium]|nr:hypothetical protein [Candidatus Paceibacterota bacterium]